MNQSSPTHALAPVIPSWRKQLDRAQRPVDDEIARGEQHHLGLDLPTLGPSANGEWRGARCRRPRPYARSPRSSASAIAPGASGSAPAEMARIGEQLMREDRREMLKRHGRGERSDRRLRANEVEAKLHPRLQRSQIVTRLDRRLVEGISCSRLWIASWVVKRLDLLGQLGRALRRDDCAPPRRRRPRPWER